MKKIITLGINLNEDHKKRLETLGELETKESPNSVEDFLIKAKGADILYSNGAFLLDSLPELKNVFVTYPYVELGAFNTEELAKNGVTVANGSGGNRDSIVEWVMFMILSLFRKFNLMVRAKKNFDVQMQESLAGKKVLVVGHGTIGTQIGKLCEAFSMQVDFFNRGDDLAAKSKVTDLIINALNCNSSSKNLLDENFFMNLKKGVYYVTFARPYTYDIEGIIKSINSDILAGAAIDCDPEKFGDTTNAFYQKCMSNEKILVTPHIAFSTNQAIAGGAEVAIKNIEAFVAGKSQNVLKKNRIIMSNYHYLLFDWDGCLADTPGVWLETYLKLYRAAGIKLEKEDVIARSWGNLEQGPKNFGIKDNKAFWEKIVSEVGKNLKTVKLHEYAKELLANLKTAGKQVAIVTSSPAKLVTPALEHHGLNQYIGALVSADDVAHEKPHPEMLFLALEKLGAKGKVQEAIVIGDTGKDILAGQNAGMDQALTLHEINKQYYDFSKLEQIEATYKVRSLEELESLLLT